MELKRSDLDYVDLVLLLFIMLKIIVLQGLRNPHDIEVDPVNLRVYVGELDPTKVWRFDMKADDGTGGHGGIIHSKSLKQAQGQSSQRNIQAQGQSSQRTVQEFTHP